MITTSADDPRGLDIIPRGIEEAHVSSTQLRIRTNLEYDATYLRHSLVSSVHVGNAVLGYSRVSVDPSHERTLMTADGRALYIAEHRKASEEAALRAVFGIEERKQHERDICGLGRDIEATTARVAYFERVRWWQLLRRYLAWRRRTNPRGVKVWIQDVVDAAMPRAGRTSEGEPKARGSFAEESERQRRKIEQAFSDS